MEAIYLLKTSLTGVVSVGVGSIVGNLSSYFLPKTLKPIAKTGVAFGTYLVTQMVTDKIADYLDKTIDEATVDE